MAKKKAAPKKEKKSVKKPKVMKSKGKNVCEFC